jgi:predicted secreted Zn-dependent protease
MRIKFALLTSLVVLPLPVLAEPTQSTKYKYYSINGDTPGDIYMAMVRRGPDVNGVNAYASTLATTSQSGRLMLGKSCRIDGYKVKIDFVINLPRLSKEGALGGSTKTQWNKFKSFLKTHEETHRSIWLGCARSLEARIAKLSSPSCAALDKEANRLFATMRAECQKKHAAFDASDQKRLLKHPFVKLVFGGRTKLARKN